jgi:hypothetical protein
MKADIDELAAIFPGTSEMARAMRAHDWSATPLGDPRAWPDALKIPMRMLLTSKFEMWLGWGPDLCFFYNDAYLPTIGIKHPVMLGRPFREVWAEVYDEVADQVERVRAGEATWNDKLLLLLERSGFPEETYHSFSYSPLYDGDGSVGGLLCVVTEDTARVISERRLETLRGLGAALANTTSREAVAEAVDDAMAANRRDFPLSHSGWRRRAPASRRGCSRPPACQRRTSATQGRYSICRRRLGRMAIGIGRRPRRSRLPFPDPAAAVRPVRCFLDSIPTAATIPTF